MNYFIFNSNAKSRFDLLLEVAEFAMLNNITTSDRKLFDALLKRELQFSTGQNDGIALPHTCIDEIRKSAIIVTKCLGGINWPSPDGELTTCVVTLCVVNDAKTAVLELDYLASMAKALLNKKNRAIFKTQSIVTISKLVDSYHRQDRFNNNSSNFIQPIFEQKRFQKLRRKFFRVKKNHWEY